MTVREQLRDAYLRSGMTAIDICEEAGVGRRTLFNALAGRPVRSENLFAICTVLRMDVIRVPSSNLHTSI
jgi:predicted transcriptional regulator